MKGIGLKKGKTFLVQASVLKRILAFIIDLLIINFVILFPILGILSKMLPEINSFSDVMNSLSSVEYSTSITVIVFITVVFHILYFVIFEKKLRQSVGKMAFNLYVESKTKDLKYWQLIVRSVFFIFPNIVRFIDFITMLFTKENQRLLEVLSKTKVVEKYKL